MEATAAVLVEPRRLEYEVIPVPEIGSDDGVLRVEASGLCGTDYEQYRGNLKGVMGSRPIIPGHEIIGHIDRIGEDAARRWGVKEGDRVAVEPIIPCGVCRDCLGGNYTRCASDLGYGLYQTTKAAPGLWGGYATHAYLHRSALVHKLPDDIPTDVMTLFNPLSNAIRWATEVPSIGPGGTLVIQGPGQRGLCALLAARAVGVDQIVVTGTERDSARLELARELGAVAALDRDATDIREAVGTLTDGKMADVVLDVSAASPSAIGDAVGLVRRGGEIVIAGMNGHKPAAALFTDDVALKEIRLLGVLSAGYESIEKAIALIAQGRFPFERLCTHTYDLNHADDALQMLGREVETTQEPLHITLTAGRPE
jgi:threonine dehydrogenase-like Zn-dependent dehydrogenase